MIRLVFSDLRDHAPVWIGALIVALACGYVGGWSPLLKVTANGYIGDVHRSLSSAGSMMLSCSLLAGVAVLLSTASLTVTSQRRSYALWLLANLSPRHVTAVVLAQLAVVALVGAILGTFLAIATFPLLFHYVFISQSSLSEVIPEIGVSGMPFVWFCVVAVFLVGGLRGARDAGRTPPVIVVREKEPDCAGVTPLRAVACACLVALACWLISTIPGADPGNVILTAFIVPAVVVAAIVPVAPLVFASFLKVWTSLAPLQSSSAWYLAGRKAYHALSVSTAIETPIMVGVGLLAGEYSVVGTLAESARQQGATDLSGFGFDLSHTLVIFGGPMLLCAIGAGISVVMSSRSRKRDVALLTAAGAQQSIQIAAAAFEALVHTLNASFVGLAAALVSDAAVAFMLRLPLLSGFDIRPGLFVALLGFALVFGTTIVPTLSALKKQVGPALSAGE